jgi:hypothetical protein
VRGTTGRRSLALLLLSSVAVLISACGSGGATLTPAALRLQREDFVSVARALSSASPSVGQEVAAAKGAWPLIANGLPADAGELPKAPVASAGKAAASVVLPPVFAEANAAALTGSGARIAGMFRNFRGLTNPGWKLISAAIAQIEHGSAAASRFARANVGLYIESVYDGHFSLAQIGKQLTDGYSKLGGPAAFGASLTQQEVDRLASAYSEAKNRLHPHVGVRVGS